MGNEQTKEQYFADAMYFVNEASQCNQIAEQYIARAENYMNKVYDLLKACSDAKQ